MRNFTKEMSQNLDVRIVSKMKSKFLALFAVAALSALLSPPLVSATPLLGDNLATFAVLGASGVSTASISHIGGNVGTAPSASITGTYVFDLAPSGGTQQPNNGLAPLAQTELDAAILAVNAHVAPPANTIAGANLNLENFQSSQFGNYIIPGTYAVGAGASNFDSTITLDGQGSNTAVWYFEFSSTLITGVSSNVVVQNVGDGAGVGIYWTAGSATLNGPTFVGNVLANAAITTDGDLTVACGRLLSADANVALNGAGSNISIGDCGGNHLNLSGGYDQGNIAGGGGGAPVPEPGTFLLLGFGLAGLVAFRKRFRKA